MRLNHNMYSLGIFKTYSRNVDNYSKAMNNVSTGYKINSAKDNPNKIAQAETLRMTVIGRNAASSNIQDTSSMLQTFDGAIQEMNNNVSRLKQLTVQAATETINDEDRAVIQKEIEEIKSSLNELANNTEFNGVKLSDNLVTDNANTTRFMKTTIGTLSGEIIDIPRFNVSTSAQSSLADADIAKEVMEITKNKILIDSGIGLMAQSNKLPQDALNILANVR